VVVTDEDRKRLQAKLKEIQARRGL
jgi:hypothetical protein